MGEGRRVVLSADRPPSALTEVDARLRSHLGAGLVCGIEPADRALRMGVLSASSALLRASSACSRPARPEVVAAPGRPLPGLDPRAGGRVNTLAARAGERLGALTVEEAESLLRPHLQRRRAAQVTVDEIQKAVAEHYRPEAGRPAVRAAHPRRRPPAPAGHVSGQAADHPLLPDIGRRFGGRDHTTVLHAVRRIEELKAEDAPIAADVEALTRKLRGATALSQRSGVTGPFAAPFPFPPRRWRGAAPGLNLVTLPLPQPVKTPRRQGRPYAA